MGGAQRQGAYDGQRERRAASAAAQMRSNTSGFTRSEWPRMTREASTL